MELETHKIKHPDIYYIDQKLLEVRRMTNIIKDYNININNFNFLNVDIQGFELEAIKSFDGLISNFDYIYTEVNTNYLYKNCPLIDEIDEYLKKYSFIRVNTIITENEWGDALYIKN